MKSAKSAKREYHIISRLFASLNDKKIADKLLQTYLNYSNVPMSQLLLVLDKFACMDVEGGAFCTKLCQTQVLGIS